MKIINDKDIRWEILNERDILHFKVIPINMRFDVDIREILLGLWEQMDMLWMCWLDKQIDWEKL